MSGTDHQYPIRMRWTGNTGQGTREYRGYERAHEYSVEGKPVIPGSSDPAFRGDRTRYNPEELLVMAISSCHMRCRSTTARIISASSPIRSTFPSATSRTHACSPEVTAQWAWPARR